MSTAGRYYYDDWTDSELWNPDWFGSASPNSTDHVINTGRWAYTQVAQVDKVAGDSTISNPYGLLRSPWNTNPTPYIMRSRFTLGYEDGGWTLPDCSLWEFAYSQPMLSGMLSALNGYLHGPVSARRKTHARTHAEGER